MYIVCTQNIESCNSKNILKIFNIGLMDKGLIELYLIQPYRIKKKTGGLRLVFNNRFYLVTAWRRLIFIF